MRSRRGILRVFGAFGAVLLLISVLPERATAARVERQTDRWVRAEAGRQPRFVDDQGRTVILRGMNVNGLGEYYQEWPDLPPTLPLTRNDFAEIAANGFNVVRLIINWSRLEPQPNLIDRVYIEQIARTVEDARVNDVYVLLDMHQDAWGLSVNTPDGITCPAPLEPSVGWDGAPAWTISMIGNVGTCHGAGLREVSPAVQLSFSRFYANALGLQDHLLRVWREVAKRFAKEPAVVGYDLMNEPNPGMTPAVNDYATLGLFYRRAIAAIRSVDKRHTIFFEPSVITGPTATPGPLPGFSNDPNMAYAPHLYNESISPLPGSIENGFTNAKIASRLYGGRPIFSGEWGWFGSSAGDQPKLLRYAAAEDAAMISGTWWQWKQACGDPHAASRGGRRPPCAGKSIYSDGFVTRSAANRAVLTRAYVRAAPGRMTSMSSLGRSGGLVLRGVADRKNAVADLWACGERQAVSVPKVGPYEISVNCL